jgi:hypothetical protein
LGEVNAFSSWTICVDAAEPAPANNATALPFGRGKTVRLIAGERAQLLGEEETLTALAIRFRGPAENQAAIDGNGCEPGSPDHRTRKIPGVSR